MSLQDQLQQTLGTSTIIEHELDGGGMSRVFVATDTTLGRRVVVKVLPSEMSGPMAVERFKLTPAAISKYRLGFDALESVSAAASDGTQES